MKLIEDLITGAKTLGACRLGSGMTNPEDAARLLFTSQGREFCLAKGYPTLEMWREIKQNVPGLREMGIYVDEGTVHIDNESRMAIIGETIAHATLSGAEQAFTVICQHGASAYIKASNYAVVRTEKDAPSHIKVFTDNTAVHLR